MPSCQACGKDASGDFAYCPFCGESFAGADTSRPSEERKVVSVLFCDLVGFTAASESADPEDVRARLRPYHSRVRAEVERFGATVEKFIGDAVMAVFGAPVVHEDDAERAVRASLQLLDAIAELNDADAALSLQVRIGVNTGEAVVDLGARPELGQAIVTGDVVNTASRLQGVAPVNGVAVSEATYLHTNRIFEYEKLGRVEVKGKREALVVWRPLRPYARLGTDVSRRHTAPLAGREWEKSLLTGTFERCALQRSGALVTLVGEPGMGKSRLSAELLQYIEERPGLVRWRQGHCLPYGDKIAFWALGEILKAECGILETDSAHEADAKLERALPAADPDRLWLKARLAPLVGLAGEAAAQDEAFAAWRRYLESWAAERATVLLFEDLHWADDAFLTFLEQLCERTRDVPLLVLCTARPELYERHPTFGVNARNAHRIDLGPLTRDETSQLIASLMGQTALSDDTHASLLERAGGNPLYAGEFVRLLDDQGRLRPRVTDLPDSVQALIAARLDLLAADRKSLLQDASVIGKVFWVGALVEMSGRGREEVTLALHELARKELVHAARTSTMDAEQEYSFSHLLVRDVCYGQIPRAARAARHRAAATWVEERAGERVEDLADVLAHHYLTALDLSRTAGQHQAAEELAERAIHYLSLAAERAMGLNAARAEVSWRRALEIASDDHPDRARLLEAWGLALLSLGRHLEAKATLEDALRRSEARGDVLGAGRALIALSIVAWVLGDADRDHAMRAVRLLEDHPGPELVAAYTEVAADQFVENDNDAAIEAAERALTLADELGLPEPARPLGFLGAARCFRGERRGLQDMRRALALAIERSQSRDASVVFSNLTLAVSMYEGPRAALDVIDEGVAFCESRGQSAMQMYVRGGALGCRAGCGLIDEALRDATILVQEADAAGDVPAAAGARWLQAKLRAQRGDVSQVDDEAEHLLTIKPRADGSARLASLGGAALLLAAARRTVRAKQMLAAVAQVTSKTEPGYPEALPDLVRCALALDDIAIARQLTEGVDAAVPVRAYALLTARACIAEKEGLIREALALFAEAVRRWHEFGNVPEHAYALLGKGRCLRALNQPGAAEALDEAEQLFTALGFQPALAEIRALR